MIIANLATYPKRIEILEEVIGTITTQVEMINIVLNEFQEIPKFIARFKNVNPIIPAKDYKDVGKFVPVVGKDDYILTIDDDIYYPHDYVSKLLRFYSKLDIEECIVGLHGTIYSDFFDGRPSSRFVYSFKEGLLKPLQVNQLGTGTTLIPGKIYPPDGYMDGSQGFVDIRLAKYCVENNIPQVCVPRNANWLRPVLHEGETIFGSVTSSPTSNIIKECLDIAGFSKLNPDLHKRLYDL